MNAVDAFLREIQGGAMLEPTGMNDRQQRFSQMRQPFSYSQAPESQQAQQMANMRTLAQSQQYSHGRVDGFSYQSQTGDPTDIPLDAFGQLRLPLQSLMLNSKQTRSCCYSPVLLGNSRLLADQHESRCAQSHLDLHEAVI